MVQVDPCWKPDPNGGGEALASGVLPMPQELVCSLGAHESASGFLVSTRFTPSWIIDSVLSGATI